ncbi:MAG: aminodeoxychorismate lyase [Pseudomonadota bacterium]|nr:aminodeoxychorismate lyase [Pseudomonadota bacterium]
MAHLQDKALVNGIAADRLSILDRGLMYGDGLFETIAVCDGDPCLWREHVGRLRRGAGRLGIPCPAEGLLREELGRVADGESPCVVKIVLTRGVGGRGYPPPVHPQPTRILIRYPWPDHPADWPEEGVVVTLCRTPLGMNPALAGVKHLNRLEQVMARSEWSDPQIAEGLMSDGKGRVIAGTMSNLFLVEGTRICTPRLHASGIEGTVRGLVLRIAGAHGFESAEVDVDDRTLCAADGLFLTNSLIGVWPVRRLGYLALDVGRLPGELIRAVRRRALTPETGTGN